MRRRFQQPHARALVRYRLALLAVGALQAACSDPLKRVDLVVDARVLGARVEVEGEPERATPAPGEVVSVRWLVADRDPEPELGWAFAACVAAPPGGGLPACETVPFASVAASMSAPGEPRFDFVVPEEVEGAALAVFGVVCPDSEPIADELDFDCTGPGGTLVSLDFELATAERRNRNPGIDAEAFRFGDEVWPPGLDCESLPNVAAGSSHALRLELNESDREPLVPEASVDPTRETLQVSHFTTFGALDRAFTVLDPNQSDLGVRVDWKAPKTSPEGGLVRFFFVVRDLRGGSDWIERAVCVEP